jgi:murein tripeptide amidase MpaA
MPIRISSAFDSGAIDVLSAAASSDIRLAIRADSHADFRQWFHFRVQGAAATPLAMTFTNAGACTYVDGWRDYRAVASYDRVRWFRVPTQFDGSTLRVAHTPDRDSVYYAYFEPYSWERHLDLLGRADASPRARVSNLCASIEGRDLDVVDVGEAGAGKIPVWIIARQHPGETMAEWFVEGLLERLLDADDATARALLARAVFHVVPNMNPDGSVRGNLRTNAAGANLNREWLEPSVERSPEVYAVRAAMHASGVGLFLDVHGDEGLPYVFVASGSQLPSWSAAQAAAERTFNAALVGANPDFQTEHGYPPGKETNVNLSLASNYVAHTFGCLALTLEMPFKDNANLPDELHGWSGARSRRLGADALVGIRAALGN